MTIAAPGERKSAVQMFMTRPIHEVERRLVVDSAADRMAAEERKQVATKAVERQRNKAARAEGDDAQLRRLVGKLASATPQYSAPPLHHVEHLVIRQDCSLPTECIYWPDALSSTLRLPQSSRRAECVLN